MEDLSRHGANLPTNNINNKLDSMQKLLNSLDPEAKGTGLLYYDETQGLYLPRSSYFQYSKLYQILVNINNPAATCKSFINSLKMIQNKSQEIFNDIATIEGSENELKDINERLSVIIDTIEKKSLPCISEIISTYSSTEKETIKIDDIKMTTDSIFSTLEKGRIFLENKLDSFLDSHSLIEFNVDDVNSLIES